MHTLTIALGDADYSVTRSKLRNWLKLESIRDKIARAVEDKDGDGLSDQICSYVSTALGIDIEIVNSSIWMEVLYAFDLLIELNSPSLKFPILVVQSKEKAAKSWEYEGRWWYTWAHEFSSAYGWSTEYVAELDIDDALGLLQEILSDEQERKEWEWGLSEISHPYNSTSKKSEFNPLPRPEWMKHSSEIKEVKKVKMLVEHLPIGNVIRYADIEKRN